MTTCNHPGIRSISGCPGGCWQRALREMDDYLDERDRVCLAMSDSDDQLEPLTPAGKYTRVLDWLEKCAITREEAVEILSRSPDEA